MAIYDYVSGAPSAGAGGSTDSGGGGGSDGVTCLRSYVFCRTELTDGVQVSGITLLGDNPDIIGNGDMWFAEWRDGKPMLTPKIGGTYRITVSLDYKLSVSLGNVFLRFRNNIDRGDAFSSSCLFIAQVNASTTLATTTISTVTDLVADTDFFLSYDPLWVSDHSSDVSNGSRAELLTFTPRVFLELIKEA